MPALVILNTIWYLLVISASASADPYIFRVISYQCPAQCLLLIVLSREALTHTAVCIYVCKYGIQADILGLISYYYSAEVSAANI